MHKVAILKKFQKFWSFDLEIFKKANVEKNVLYFFNWNFETTVQYVCHECMDYTYAKFQVNRFENDFHVVQKFQKCPYLIFSNSFFDQSMQHRKMKIALLNSPSNFASTAFVAKITALKLSPFSPGSLIFMSWNLSWPWTHIWPFLKKVKRSSEPSCYELLIAAFRVFLPPFVFELAVGNIYPPPQRRAGVTSRTNRVKELKVDPDKKFTRPALTSLHAANSHLYSAVS